MTTVRRILTGSALVVLAAGLASADTIITTNATTVGPTTTDFAWSLVFGATATPVGTHLVSATLEIDATINDTVLNLTNQSGLSQTFRFISSSEADVLTNSVDGTLVGTATSPTTVLNTGFVTFTPGQTQNYAPITLTAKSGPTTVANAAGYLAGATIGGVTSTGTTFNGGGGNIKLLQTQTAVINGILTFDFAPNVTTPEPVTMALVGFGLIGIGFLRKRIRS